MKKPYIIFYSFLLMACALALPSCGQSSDKTKSTISAEDDRPPLEFTDADRTFNVNFEISSDSLLTCHNSFNDKDENPLILDTTNPGFPDFLAKWFDSMEPNQIDDLKNDSGIHIIVGSGVSDATLEKVKQSIIGCGIKNISISNF